MRFSVNKKAMMMSMYIGPAFVGILIGAALIYFLLWKELIPCPG